eukprot:gene820-1596_t
MSRSSSSVGLSISPSKNRFPYCIVWSPLPPITWIFPFIGHMGVCNSNGVIHDFAGPYTIGVGQFAFGAPTRYLVLDPSKCSSISWDDALEEGCEIYSHRMHNICCDNCHSHVAKCLNIMGYENYSKYDMFVLGAWVFFYGSFTGIGGVLKTFVPFVIQEKVPVPTVTTIGHAFFSLSKEYINFFGSLVKLPKKYNMS